MQIDPEMPTRRADSGPAEEAPPATPVPGRQWGKYLIEKGLGAGGQARVFQAYDRFGAAGHVALKVPRAPVPRAEIHQWVETEAAPLVNLEHPNIVRVVDAGAIGGLPYVATELVEGLPLNEYVRANPPTFRQMLDWTTQLAGALRAAHSRGIVHRDLKPLNVIVTPEGTPRLIDFGLASLVTAYRPEPRRDAAGTYPFMAPEQARGDPEADQRVDIFALGGLLKYMLVGEGPYHGAESALRAARRGEVAPIAETRGTPLRRSLCRIANRALAADPSDRYQNMAEMLRALRSVRSRRALIVGVGGTVAAGAIAAAVLALTGVFGSGGAAPQAELRVYLQRPGAGDARRPLTPELLPLQPDDRIHVHATLSEPLHAHVLAVGSAGGRLPLYPPEGTAPKPVREIHVPAVHDDWMNPPFAAGTLTILLAARREPIEDVRIPLQRVLALARTPVIGGQGMLVVDERGLHRFPSRRLAQAGSRRVVIDEGFLGELRERATEEWDVVRAIAVPVGRAEEQREQRPGSRLLRELQRRRPEAPRRRD